MPSKPSKQLMNKLALISLNKYFLVYQMLFTCFIDHTKLYISEKLSILKIKRTSEELDHVLRYFMRFRIILYNSEKLLND